MFHSRFLFILSLAFALYTGPAQAFDVCRALFGNGQFSLSDRTDLGDIFSSGPFTEVSARYTVAELQWNALNTILQDTSITGSVHDIARKKIAYFQAPSDNDAFKKAMAKTENRFHSLLAVDYVLRTFQSPKHDVDFRLALIRFLSERRGLERPAIHALLPSARGAIFASSHEPYRAQEAIGTILERMNGTVPRTVTIEKSLLSAAHLTLISEPIIGDLEQKKGSANTVFLANFRTSKAIYKPARGELDFNTGKTEFIGFGREVSTQQTVEEFLGNRRSRELGLSRIIIPASIEALVHDPKTGWGIGALQAFQTGYVTLKDFIAKRNAVWERLRNTKAWDETEARIRTIDYLLGNHDRFPNSKFRDGNYGNIMIRYDEATGEFSVALIDNSLGRPGSVDFGIQNAPLPEDIPADLARTVLAFDTRAFSAAMNDYLPANGIEDFNQRVVLLQQRLRRH